jgi:hypothetical protein
VLVAIRKDGHRVVWSDAIKKEWKTHASHLAQRWRRAMAERGQTVELGNHAVDERLRLAIRAQAHNSGEEGAMLKDAHLLEAARATDRRVISLEERCARHFARLARAHGVIGDIMWVNPMHGDPDGMAWLKAGAKDDSRYHLVNLMQDDSNQS